MGITISSGYMCMFLLNLKSKENVTGIVLVVQKKKICQQNFLFSEILSFVLISLVKNDRGKAGGTQFDKK